MENIKCIEIDHNPTICSAPPWIDVLKTRFKNVPKSEVAMVVARISYVNLLILRLLGIKTLGKTNNEFIIGYIGEPDNSNSRKISILLNSDDWYVLYSHKLPKFLALPLAEISRVLIYVTIGILGTLVNLATVIICYSIISKYLGLASNTIASILGFETSVLFNFTLHEVITFRGTGLSKAIRDVFERLIKYHSASIASFLSQVSMANLIPFLFKTPVWIGQLIGIIVGFIINFILGYLYTWSRHRIK
ncbi:MAG: GtrA family protein [Desulfurococcaceae archaeon]